VHRVFLECGCSSGGEDQEVRSEKRIATVGLWGQEFAELEGCSNTMRIRAALSVFCCLLQGSQAQVDISGCCTHVKIETTGEARRHQGNRIGEYRLTGVLADRPIYKNVEREEFLFYLQSNKKGLWMVGPTAGQFNGGLAHRGDTHCVEDVRANQWKYTDGSAWHVDSHLRVSCLDETVTPQCLYNDQTEFIGGDLPEVFGGGGVETSMESSADCIEECEKRSGCKYWTWVMGEKVNCFLKNSKVEMVRKPKYVSGSIPQACISTPSTPTQAPSTYTDCTYKNLDFQGGDLFTVLALDVDDCRKQCEEHVSCQLFTYDRNLERGCYFKTDQVTVINNEEVISGATAEICEDFILPHVTKKNEEPVFNENEVNAKFKITSLRWDEKLNDPNSQEYQDLSNTIEDSIESMLRSERDLDEQAEFSVEVKKFRKGSVVCDFKVNYILKEAYVAIPFAIKPSNISDAMSKNFKFKKGILFQRFLIAAGSFNSSAPVDHCAAKGCSHKCDYDYDIEDYLCTCPRSLVLDSAGKTCIDPAEAATEETVSDTTDDTTTNESIDESEQEEEATTEVPEVKLTLLPSDCLWSPWSDWTSCSSSCGEGKMERQRSVVLPEKNGGACPGGFKEVVDCSTDCEDKDENETTESSIIASTDDNAETTTSNAKESEETATESQTEEQTEDGSALANELEDDIEETVTKSESHDGEKEGSGTTISDEQTTVANIIEEVVTILPNQNVKSNTEKSSEDKEVAETVTMQADENTTKEDLESGEATTEFGENFQEVTTDVSNQNDNNNEQTTMSSDDGELDDAFGRRITTDATGQTEEIDGITIAVTDLETTTESKGETSDEEKEKEDMKDIDKDEDTRIVFPLTEDVEIIPTTKSTEENLTTENTEEAEPKTESPSTVADMVNEEGTEYTTTTMEETEEKIGEENVETAMEDEFETTTQMQETTSPEFKDISKNNEEKIIDNGLDDSESESTTKIPYEADTETAIDNQDNVENRSQSESTTMKDFKTDKEHEYETTTHIDEDISETPSSKDLGSVTEVTTIKRDDSTDSLVTQTTISPDILEDSDEAAQTISKELETDESGSDATTVVDTTGEDEITTVQTIAAEGTEKNIDTQTTLDDHGEDMEKTTKGSPSPADDAPTKAPRFDTENELKEDDTTNAPDVDETTNAAEFTTLNPIVDDAETTTVAIISIEETDDEVTIVTTAKPYIQEDVEGNENTVEQEITTADDIIEQSTESLIEEENPTESETSDTDISTTTHSVQEEETTTTPSDEYSDHDHEFLCKESSVSDDKSDVPLECVLTNGEDKRTVFLVIPGDSLGGDRNKLFNKNVKIVVKDFMIMERGPRTLS